MTFENFVGYVLVFCALGLGAWSLLASAYGWLLIAACLLVAGCLLLRKRRRDESAVDGIDVLTDAINVFDD